MDKMKEKVRKLEKTAWDPYERIENPSAEDWKKSYDALRELSEIFPEEGSYPNTLGYLCYYGRHTGGERQYEEARKWFERGAELRMIESTYKLADMLTDGLGGPKDPKTALYLYVDMYLFCREQFESGMMNSKFADTALRMGRIHHEGKLAPRDDMEALGFLLEAKYALEERERFDHYGDDTVMKNILRLMDECGLPDEKTRQQKYFGIGLGRVPHYLLAGPKTQMTIDVELEEEGFLRLEFRQKRTDGKKPNRILWAVPPAMKCMMTDSIVLYGAEVRQIWTKTPGEQVVCDRYQFDKESDTHQFFLGKELQCKLQGGEYVLPMDEFWMTLIRDHPDSAGAGVQ